MSELTPGESIWSTGTMNEDAKPLPEITRAEDIPPLSGKSITSTEGFYNSPISASPKDPNPTGKLKIPTNVETEAMKNWRKAQEDITAPSAETFSKSEAIPFSANEQKTVEISGSQVESPDYGEGVLDLVRELKEAQLDKRNPNELLNFLGGAYDLGKANIEPVHTLQGQDLPPYAQGKVFRAVLNGRVLAVGIGNSLRNVRIIAGQNEPLPN